MTEHFSNTIFNNSFFQSNYPNVQDVLKRLGVEQHTS